MQKYREGTDYTLQMLTWECRGASYFAVERFSASVSRIVDSLWFFGALTHYRSIYSSSRLNGALTAFQAHRFLGFGSLSSFSPRAQRAWPL